jgi:hypothetical protein
MDAKLIMWLAFQNVFYLDRKTNQVWTVQGKPACKSRVPYCMTVSAVSGQTFLLRSLWHIWQRRSSDRNANPIQKLGIIIFIIRTIIDKMFIKDFFHFPIMMNCKEWSYVKILKIDYDNLSLKDDEKYHNNYVLSFMVIGNHRNRMGW